MIKLTKLLTELHTSRDGDIDLRKIKRIQFSYTSQTGYFYAVYLYNKGKDPHAKSSSWTYKISYEDEVEEMFKEFGINLGMPRRYDTRELEAICQEITSRTGIAADYDDSMDVS